MIRPALRSSERRSILRRRLQLQRLEIRSLMAADLPVGATPIDTGEFLLGSVTVTPVLFESNGEIDANTQDWTGDEIDAVLDKVRESVDWWSDLLATKTSAHSLSFEIDETYARNPVETGYEPIDRTSGTFERYVGQWLTDLGYGDAGSIERAAHLFNDSQRQTHQTDWAFTIFVVDSSDDADGFFPSGGFRGAFAYPGGLFYVVPSERPVSTYAHEMGHIFWARDEYSGAGSYTDRRGYYNAQNINAADNPAPGFVQEDSIMRSGSNAIYAFDNLVTADSTLALLGWQDSDGDGIFDVADVPLELDAAGWYDESSGDYFFKGSTAVATLPNENSAGTQSDITLARIGALQYQLDEGPWIDALTADAAELEFDLAVAIDQPFDLIRWRAIDTETGNTSDVLSGDRVTPIFSGAGGAYAFMDRDGDRSRDAGEPLLQGADFVVTAADGTPLYFRSVRADDLSGDDIETVNGLTFTTQGIDADGSVAVLEPAADVSASKVFGTYDPIRQRSVDRWGGERKLDVTADRSTGRVEIDFVALDTGSYGLDLGSYARVEAYDRDGNRLSRVTSELVAAGDSGTLVIEDSAGTIARVLIYGHAETEILVTAVRFGHDSLVSQNSDGTIALDTLPDGNYRLEATSPSVLYRFDTESALFQVSGGSVPTVALAASRTTSTRHNVDSPGDVNGDGEVTALDALVVINDLGNFGSRVISADETGTTWIDVNNDGSATPVDALSVINILARESSQLTAEPEAESYAPEQVTPSGTEAKPSGGAVSDEPVQWQQEAPALAQTAVDEVFRRQDQLESENRYGSQTLSNPKLLNSAARVVSGQSPTVVPSDTRSWTVSLPDGMERADSAEQLSASEIFRENEKIGFGVDLCLRQREQF